MATGYIVSGRGDLDSLFAPRTTAAGAATGFLSNGGVDLAQRFESRGSATAIANTNFKAGATDLAQRFLDIAGTTVMPRTLVPADGGAGVVRYSSGHYGTPAFGTMTPTNLYYAWRFVEFIYSPGVNCYMSIGNDAGPPPNTDATWNAMSITGVFADSGGSSVTRNVTRAGALSTTANAFYRVWFFGTAAFQMIVGNSYSVNVTKV
jgi:hypothetical protein